MPSVDRPRLLVAALVVVAGVGLFLAGAGGGDPGGTVAPNAVPAADVTVDPGDPGTATVRFAGTGDWETATLSVDWNGSLSVVEGDRRLERIGDAVTLREQGEGDTHVRLTVTATGEGETAVVYRRTVRL